MIYIGITSLALITKLEKDHSVIELRHLKNVVIFFKQFYVFCCPAKFYNFFCELLF